MVSPTPSPTSSSLKQLFKFFSWAGKCYDMNKKKVLVGILFLLFLIEITPTIVTNSQTPPSASAYVASITVSSNPFILDTATLPIEATVPHNLRAGSNLRNPFSLNSNFCLLYPSRTFPLFSSRSLGFSGTKLKLGRLTQTAVKSFLPDCRS